MLYSFDGDRAWSLLASRYKGDYSTRVAMTLRLLHATGATHFTYPSLTAAALCTRNQFPMWTLRGLEVLVYAGRIYEAH